MFRMTEGSHAASLEPDLRVYRPDGTALCSITDLKIAEVQCTLDANGIYTVLTGDEFSQDPGDYGIFVQRTNNPGNAVPIAFGETIATTLALTAQVDTYTFDGGATAGDIVLFRMAEALTSASLEPDLRVFRPDGTVWYSITDLSISEIQCTLDATGTHAILAGDDFGQDTGDYGIFLQRINNPGNVTPIAFGETIATTLALTAEIDTYTFDGGATAGDIVVFRMAEALTSASLEPDLRVYRPDGTVLCSTTDLSISEVECTLDATGTHAILAGDDFGQDTGDYGIFLQRVTNPGDVTPIAFGETIATTLAVTAQMDTYTFDGGATAGDIVVFRMAEALTSAALEPDLRVYRPDGALLCSFTKGLSRNN